jgi:AAA family ATP:ADP antiporter
MADIWSDLQARRLFPIIALGGTAGAVFGPLITRILIGDIKSSSLLWISIGLLIIAIYCIVSLGKWANQFGVHKDEIDNEAALGGGMWDGLKQIFSNWFICSMAIIMLMNDAIGTIAYALVIDYSGSAFRHDAIAQTQFAANLDLMSNGLQIIVQLTLTRWLLVRYGASTVFAVCALIVVAACLWMAVLKDPFLPVIGQIPFVALVLVLTRSLSHSMVQPARETLYTLVTRDLRYKGKNAVDTVVWRIGDVLSLLSINGLKAVGVTVSGFGLIWAGLAALSGAIGWRLAKEVETPPPKPRY